MSGLSDYSAKFELAAVTGQNGSLATTVFLALMTAVDTDAGTGGTEVTGGSYARVQVAGQLACTAVTASTTITLSSTAPSWLVAGNPGLGNGAGATVWTTAGVFIGTVSSISGTTLTLTGTAAATGATTICISAFAQPSGSAPVTINNGAVITFPQATASWGNVDAFELRDAVTSGNLLVLDYLGAFSWLPCTVSSASPGVITAHAHGYSNGDTFVFSVEYGGTAPTFSAGNYTGNQTVAGSATDTFNVTGVNTSATGNGAVRKVLVQNIAINVTASFAASTFSVSAA